ncbi:50S ribosomal protein L23 [bacterium HR26]|jgi:large subunit ribosomal protein L23|nr:50S ribosomal protein L23 [bacterium HR26]
MDYQDILRRPIITEKNTRLMEMNQYTFEVAPEANKIQIKEAVERTFNVKVKKVNTMNVRGKPRRRIRRRGRVPVVGREASWKKAIVTLEPGYTIDLFSQL